MNVKLLLVLLLASCLAALQIRYMVLSSSSSPSSETRHDKHTTGKPRTKEEPSPLEDRLSKANALFTFMKSKGRPFFDEHEKPKKLSSSHNITVDIVSIGTQSALHLLEAQSQTWASHSSVRHFLGVTEADDADPTCFLKLNRSVAQDVSNYCRYKAKRRNYQHSKLMQYQLNSFVHDKHLEKKGPGWMCNVRRSSHAWGKLGRFYREIPSSLPDYLLMIDDDTYYNMELFQDIVQSMDPSIALAEAGCLIQSPAHLVNNSFPFGGFGAIFTRAALVNLVRPITCDGESGQDDDFVQHACHQLKDNIIGEHDSFVNGMSLTDLMDAHGARDPFVNFARWEQSSHPWCMHSDWITGVYTNYYQVTEHISHPAYQNPERGAFFKDLPPFRVGSRLGILYGNPKRNPPLNCLNGAAEGDRRCDASQQLCHRQTPETMRQMTDIVKSQAHPDAYRETFVTTTTWHDITLDGHSFLVSTTNHHG